MKQSLGIFDKPERTQGQATEEKENGRCHTREISRSQHYVIEMWTLF